MPWVNINVSERVKGNAKESKEIFKVACQAKFESCYVLRMTCNSRCFSEALLWSSKLSLIPKLLNMMTKIQSQVFLSVLNLSVLRSLSTFSINFSNKDLCFSASLWYCLASIACQMLILVCSFVEKLKVETFVVPHLYATNINVIEKECHEGVVREWRGHRWRLCDKHNYKCGVE